MKKSALFRLLVCVLIAVELIYGCSMYFRVSAAAYTGDDASVSAGSNSIDSTRPLLGNQKMLTTAASVLVYEVNSDTLVYAYNADERIEPASLVKIMTAMLALEHGNLEDKVTATATALSPIPEYASTLLMKAGETFTLDELMYCLLVGSANDAANVIAEHIGGTIQNFVKMMNDRAAELGCTNTNFVNAHGLNNKNQYSSARDLAKILRAAMEYEQFWVYFSALEYKVEATELSEARYLVTTNYLMTPGSSQIYYDRRVTGGRTGVTNSRERSLITTAESGGLEYICVVMNCTPTFAHDDFTVMRFGSYEETLNLLDIIFDDLHVTQILYDEQITTQFSVPNGDSSVVAGPSMSISTVLPKDVTIDDLTYQYADRPRDLSAPIEVGDYMGTVQVWYGSICLAQSPIYAHNSVNLVSNDTDGTDTQTGDALTTGLIVLSVLIILMIGGAITLYLIRRYNIARARMTRRRRRRDRRRSQEL